MHDGLNLVFLIFQLGIKTFIGNELLIDPTNSLLQPFPDYDFIIQANANIFESQLHIGDGLLVHFDDVLVLSDLIGQIIVFIFQIVYFILQFLNLVYFLYQWACEFGILFYNCVDLLVSLFDAVVVAHHLLHLLFVLRSLIC